MFASRQAFEEQADPSGSLVLRRNIPWAHGETDNERLNAFWRLISGWKVQTRVKVKSGNGGDLYC
jgi:hypothetical protein